VGNFTDLSERNVPSMLAEQAAMVAAQARMALSANFIPSAASSR
jgi:hypothetical protein